METIKVAVVVMVLTLAIFASPQVLTTLPAVVHEINVNSTCSSVEELVMTTQSILNAVKDIISMLMPECGYGLWRKVVGLNFSDVTQQCPAAWMEFTSPTRSYGRPVNAAEGCDKVSFPVTAQFQGCVEELLQEYSIVLMDLQVLGLEMMKTMWMVSV